ncbi:unnamed protein product [Ambrosiozyma monospora]|uniref:Unnamed protein product n=1 Tax=Ambrosiozyma monospora TaxID=43982 RepID=A0A9W6TB65_AMBMO|nr:unnamed protein product [Ambrosiozyma monospora]
MNQDRLQFRESFILQLDFQKAFERVRHHFLKQQLQQIFVPSTIINAIMLIVSQQQGQVCINDFLCSTFSISQGLRQGDPPSPLSFALVMDPLNRTVSSSLEGINTEDGQVRMKMILMADDVIATIADEKDATKFHNLISGFEKISNLKLNPTKSTAYGTTWAQNAIIKNWDIMIKSTTDDTFIYLGTPPE